MPQRDRRDCLQRLLKARSYGRDHLDGTDSPQCFQLVFDLATTQACTNQVGAVQQPHEDSLTDFKRVVRVPSWSSSS